MADAVLIVDDDRDLREMLEHLLHLEGFAPITAPNGLEALNLLRAGAPIKVILLDLTMPIMDGWTFRAAQRADAALAAIPVIVMTAVEQHPPDGLAPVAFLRKPIGVDRLLAEVRAICERG